LKYLLFIILSILLTSCVNNKGISLKYYDNCTPYYDLYGVYHEECTNNVINYKKEEKNIGDCLQCK
jgi:hypothetical protein